jgi:hypothetical protein
MTLLTFRATSCGVLRRLTSLLLLLVALSLAGTPVVHAREAQAAPIDCSGAIHADDDADRSAPDADNFMPHHHSSCHGSALWLIGNGASASPPAVIGHIHELVRVAALPSRTSDPALRPPTA